MAYIKLLKLTATGPHDKISTIEFGKKATLIAALLTQERHVFLNALTLF